MQPNPHTNRVIRGFTILELIVALGVTVLMLFMISALFTVTSDGVSLGVAVSDVIGAGRAVGDQMERDAAAMVRPNVSGVDGGLMVIICQRVKLPYMERRVLKERWVRMDQIMWIRTANASGSANPEVVAMAPARVSQFAPPTPDETKSALYGRLWYGHVLKTPPNGTAPSAFGAPGPNRVANNLALGRQMLLLCSDTRAMEGAPAYNPPAPGVPQPAYAGVARANKNIAWNAPVVGITHPAGLTMLYQGITDVAYMPYLYNSELPSPPATGPNPGGVIDNDDPGLPANPNGNRLYWHQPDAQYKDRVMNLLFYPEPRRLWANPNPEINLTNPFPAGLIAQRHALFMDNVSDFIVEFAADALDDPAISNVLDPYGDGVPDSFTGGVNAGETIWYGLADNDKANSKGPPSWFNFPYTQLPGGLSNVPSPNKVDLGPDAVAYIFRHDFPQRWPYMIRFRFRIHDQRGELQGDESPEKEIPVTGPTEGTNVGKWFEQIVKVNRD